MGQACGLAQSPGSRKEEAADAKQEGLTPARVRHPHHGNLWAVWALDLAQGVCDAGWRGWGPDSIFKGAGQPQAWMLTEQVACVLALPVPVEAPGATSGPRVLFLETGRSILNLPAKPCGCLHVCVFAGVCGPTPWKSRGPAHVLGCLRLVGGWRVLPPGDARPCGLCWPRSDACAWFRGRSPLTCPKFCEGALDPALGSKALTETQGADGSEPGTGRQGSEALRAPGTPAHEPAPAASTTRFLHCRHAHAGWQGDSGDASPSFRKRPVAGGGPGASGEARDRTCSTTLCLRQA